MTTSVTNRTQLRCWLDGRRTIRSWPTTTSPSIAHMGGVPCIRGTRVTVRMVLGQLAAGHTVDEVLADYPYLERPDVLSALEFAAAIVNEREVPIARLA